MEGRGAAGAAGEAGVGEGPNASASSLTSTVGASSTAGVVGAEGMGRFSAALPSAFLSDGASPSSLTEAACAATSTCADETAAAALTALAPFAPAPPPLPPNPSELHPKFLSVHPPPPSKLPADSVLARSCASALARASCSCCLRALKPARKFGGAFFVAEAEGAAEEEDPKEGKEGRVTLGSGFEGRTSEANPSVRLEKEAVQRLLCSASRAGERADSASGWRGGKGVLGRASGSEWMERVLRVVVREERRRTRARRSSSVREGGEGFFALVGVVSESYCGEEADEGGRCGRERSFES